MLKVWDEAVRRCSSRRLCHRLASLGHPKDQRSHQDQEAEHEEHVLGADIWINTPPSKPPETYPIPINALLKMLWAVAPIPAGAFSSA